MKIFYFFLLCLSFSLTAKPLEDRDIAKISEAMGHLIGKNLEALGLELDIQAIVKGLQDVSSGKNSPMNEEECAEAIAALQAQQNRQEADDFLNDNQEGEGIVALENGKLQYKILKEGTGQMVESYNSPIIRYTARYLSGQLIGSTTEDELISLDETIPGFQKGIIGMKEGEVRTLYLHPDFYGKQAQALPEALVIFEVELIKADGSADAQALSNFDDQLPQILDTDDSYTSPKQKV